MARVHYNHEVGERVQVEASPHSGDGRNHNGKVGTILRHEPDWDDDRTWPECIIEWDGGGTSSVLDYNLRRV